MIVMTLLFAMPSTSSRNKRDKNGDGVGTLLVDSIKNSTSIATPTHMDIYNTIAVIGMAIV